MNSGKMMNVPPHATIERMLTTMPVTCARGAAAIDRSARGQCKAVLKDERGADQAQVGQHRALGPPGRARRVENDRGVFLLAALRRRRTPRLHQCLPRLGAIAGRSGNLADDHAPTDAADLVCRRKPRREVGVVDQQRGAAIVERVRDLGRSGNGC